jgi:head-tail adaptor
MQIGKLDRRISLYNATTAANNYGEKTISEWSLYTTRWASIKWKGGKESEENDKIQGLSKVHFVLRNQNLTDLTLETKITYDSKDYYIIVINELGGREDLIELITENKY